MVTLMPTITRAHNRQVPMMRGSSVRAIGVATPKRNGQHGSAKCRTNRLSPEIASSDSQPERAATQPRSTSEEGESVLEDVQHSRCRRQRLFRPLILPE